MDAFLTVCVILGVFGIQAATGLLHCIECTHIIWNSDNRNMHYQQAQATNDFTWIRSIDQMIGQRFSPACASEDPVNWSPSNDPAMQQPGTSYPTIVPISEAVCPAFTARERCNYMKGTLMVYIKQYDKTIKLHMYLRNCREATNSLLKDICYQRSSEFGYSELKNIFQNALTFIGPGTTVNTFEGFHCLCSFNNCAVFTQGATSVTVSMFTLLAAIAAFYVFRR